ncbi:hypothetical protein Hanom_Chr01g00084851 [Helianthus anomalus]
MLHPYYSSSHIISIIISNPLITLHAMHSQVFFFQSVNFQAIRFKVCPLLPMR